MNELVLTPPELRVLGCLAEKARATPQYYPLTLNGLRLACNQTTGRDPVVDYDDATVEAALASLKDKGFVRFVFSPSNRVTKYRHILDERFALDEAELAVLTVLMLRGAQTVGEIKGRSERLHAFDDLGEVEATLDRLAARTDPLVARLPRRPGQKEARYVHLVGRDVQAIGDDGAVDGGQLSSGTVVDGPGPGGRDDRIAALEAEVRSLRGELDLLRQELEAFRGELS